MRSIELQRQADERGLWLETARVLYFKTVSVDQTLDPVDTAEVERIAEPYRGRFLKVKQADQLCELIRQSLHLRGRRWKGFACKVQGTILKIKIKP